MINFSNKLSQFEMVPTHVFTHLYTKKAELEIEIGKAEALVK